MKSNGDQKMTKRYHSHFLIFLIAAVLFFICFNADAQELMQFDSEAKTPDSEKRIIAAGNVESVFSSLLALETNPERIKAFKIAHKDWLTLRKSHCAELIKDNKKLIECYEALDTQRIEIYNDQRISLLFDCPSQGKLSNNPIRIAYSQQQRKNPAAPRSVVVSADAPVAAVTFNNDMTEIFDLVNGQRINRISTRYAKNKGFGDRFFLSPNGRILIWRVYTPKTELAMWDVRTGELLRHKTLLQYTQVPMSRGRYFVYSDKESIGIYDLIKGEFTWNVEKGKDGISLMALSPDDKYLIVARSQSIENWELAKETDGKLSFVMRGTEPVADTTYYPTTIAFANDNKSFYITYGISRRGLIVQRRLPDLKEMRQLQFPKLQYATLAQIKNTDLLLMEAVSSRREAFYVDMVGETAQKIAEHTGENSKMVPLANGQVLLATSFELKTLNVPSNKGFGKFSDVIGEVISQDMPLKTPAKESDKVIVPLQVDCQNFQTEVIGVYEGSLPNNRSRGFGEKTAGYVDVNVSHTDLPVKLVLSSYQPVIWRLHISSDARISDIYLSGSNESRIEGIRSIRVSYIGNAFAYENPNMPSSRHSIRGNTEPSLASAVKQNTGCNITKFQGVYRGSNFYIGYITKGTSEKNEIYKYIDEKGNVIYKNY